MNTKQIFFTMALLNLTTFVKGQKVDLFSQLNNDSIKFIIWIVQPDWEKDQFYSETLVGVKSFDSLSRVTIKDLKKDEWIKLLNDKRYDWAANLALYELHRKYGGIFRVYDTREKWIKTQKAKDIAYWKKKLK